LFKLQRLDCLSNGAFQQATGFEQLFCVLLFGTVIGFFAHESALLPKLPHSRFCHVAQIS
jgi:hypothetical protein